ncbi:MAG: histidine phosphatase family protein [Deltaproteobacteria bacterium]|nr:histidine phosphatase family protein [Deltaproteobacteria bacterium]
MKLILVRHGETLWNRDNRVQGFTDIELSDLGIRQAQRLAESLKDEKIEAIYASTLKRAYHTAEIIDSYHGVGIETDTDLRELNQGDFEGLNFRQLRDQYSDFLKQWISQPGTMVMPNGESLRDLQDRSWQVMERIISGSKNALVVSHAFTLMATLCRIKGIEIDRFRELHVDVASRTYVEFEDGRGTITLLNGKDHLKDLAATEHRDRRQ